METDYYSTFREICTAGAVTPKGPKINFLQVLSQKVILEPIEIINLTTYSA